MKKNLAIISGITSEIGQAYAKGFLGKGAKVIGISRSEAKLPKGVEHLKVDLLDKNACKKAVERINLEGVGKVIYIHSVGEWKLEPRGLDKYSPVKDANVSKYVGTPTAIDKEVYRSHNDTFDNIIAPLLEKRRENNIPLVMCTFGSVSAQHMPRYWTSYNLATLILGTRAAEIAEAEMKQNFMQRGQDSVPVKALHIQLSSVDTRDERRLRPLAKKKEWLKPAEIVEKTLPKMFEDFGQSNYSEKIDVFHPSKLHEKEYLAGEPLHRKIGSRWLVETGFGAGILLQKGKRWVSRLRKRK